MYICRNFWTTDLMLLCVPPPCPLGGGRICGVPRRKETLWDPPLPPPPRFSFYVLFGSSLQYENGQLLKIISAIISIMALSLDCAKRLGLETKKKYVSVFKTKSNNFFCIFCLKLIVIFHLETYESLDMYKMAGPQILSFNSRPLAIYIWRMNRLQFTYRK